MSTVDNLVDAYIKYNDSANRDYVRRRLASVVEQLDKESEKPMVEWSYEFSNSGVAPFDQFFGGDPGIETVEDVASLLNEDYLGADDVVYDWNLAMNQETSIMFIMGDRYVMWNSYTNQWEVGDL